jgi:metal-sulfur cluster biosynthetic enzyme
VSLDTLEREAEVRLALDRVTDPELDEPVTDLRFIERLTVDPDGIVSIGFRLPTYWCAANFAFLMAADMQREVATLPWVRQVKVTLGEHMYAEKSTTAWQTGYPSRPASAMRPVPTSMNCVAPS